MHATIYGRGQMVIPAEARREAGIGQGDLVEVRPEGNVRIVLIRMERPKAPGPGRAKIRSRRGTHAVGFMGRTITSDEDRKLLSEV